MTDEGAETVADAAVVGDADEVVDTTVETVESTVADDTGAEAVTDGAEPVTDESLIFAPPAESTGRRWVLPVAGAVCAALLASTGALGWQVWQQHQVAAVSYAQVLTSIDSNKVDENFKEVLDGATGEFKDMYSQSSVELRQLLVENKATAHGVVVDSAVQEASKNKVVVLLFVDQAVTNTKLPDPRIDRSRMKMTLEKVDGRWRASKVELP
jgi:Mce-associated membrane protein